MVSIQPEVVAEIEGLIPGERADLRLTYLSGDGEYADNVNVTEQGFYVVATLVNADGNYYRPVTDTMYDVICNTGGAIVFLIHYVVHVCTKKSLLLGAMKKDFSKGKKPEKDAEPAPQKEE